jgi:hypothetical protein
MKWKAAAATAATIVTTASVWTIENQGGSDERTRQVSDQLCVTVDPVWVLGQPVTNSFTACVPSPILTI